MHRRLPAHDHDRRRGTDGDVVAGPGAALLGKLCECVIDQIAGIVRAPGARVRGRLHMSAAVSRLNDGTLTGRDKASQPLTLPGHLGLAQA
jgi:hypothetical protein